MTTYRHPNNYERTAIWKGTMQVQLTGDNGELFPVHIPIVDLSEDIEMRSYLLGVAQALDQKLEDYEVPLMRAAVFLCLN